MTRVEQPLLSVAGLEVRFGDDAPAVHDVELTVRSGQTVAVVGESGSGKSTLMHILGCLDTPTTGTFRLAGENVSSMTEEALAEVRNRRIGFVFQQFNLLPSMTAWQNVELPLIYAGIPTGERIERAKAALTAVGMESRMTHKPNELSGGQRPRSRVSVSPGLCPERCHAPRL